MRDYAVLQMRGGECEVFLGMTHTVIQIPVLPRGQNVNLPLWEDAD